MSKPVIINGRFHGPPGSGNGGYSCGIVGKMIDGPAAVRLHSPPPLDVPMEVRFTEGGVELYDNDKRVVSARPATVDIEVPQAPDF